MNDERKMKPTTDHEKLNKIIRNLKITLQESWGYFFTLQNINSWENPGMHPAPATRFFGLVYFACDRSYISTLSGLISMDGDSINLNYLLNIANVSLDLFEFADKAEIENSIQKHRDWLKRVNMDGAIGNRIIGKRNKIVNHTDRKYATQREPDFISANPPFNSNEVNEIEKVYIQIMEILNKYDCYFTGPKMEDELDRSAREDLEYLFHLIEKEGG